MSYADVVSYGRKDDCSMAYYPYRTCLLSGSSNDDLANVSTAFKSKNAYWHSVYTGINF